MIHDSDLVLGIAACYCVDGNEILIVDYSFSDLICEVFAFQAKKSDQNLKEITNKVYFDVEIAGKPAGMFYFASFEF